MHRALTWATAIVNRMPYVTVEATHLGRDEPGVVMPVPLVRAGQGERRRVGSPDRQSTYWEIRDVDFELGGLTAVVAVVLAAADVASAVQYVTPVPLGKSVARRSATSRPASTQVPIITWGGDIATVYANGNQATTAPNSIFGKLGLQAAPGARRRLRQAARSVSRRALAVPARHARHDQHGGRGGVARSAHQAGHHLPDDLVGRRRRAGREAAGINSVKDLRGKTDRAAGVRTARRLPDQDPRATRASPRATSR